VRPHVADKKFPIGGRPFNAVAHFADPVKTNPVRGHEIEFSTEIGRGSLSLDLTNNARNVEQLSGGAEERFVVGIETKDVMAEEFADVKKVTGAATKIEDAQRRRAIEPKVLGALDIDVDPIDDVLETIDAGRAGLIRKLLAQSFELGAVELFRNAASVDGMGGTAEMFERAGEEIRRK